MRRFLLSCLLIVAFSLALGAAAMAESGRASWYQSGTRTASGERFHPNGISCAHRRHAFGTELRVTNLANGKSVVCRVNDRGPYIRGRIVDLSKGAARVIGMVRRGVVRVSIEVMR